MALGLLYNVFTVMTGVIVGGVSGGVTVESAGRGKGLVEIGVWVQSVKERQKLDGRFEVEGSAKVVRRRYRVESLLC